MIASETPLAGLLLLQLTRASDDRGHFERVFRAEDCSPPMPSMLQFPQINLSFTRRAGCIRGLHFQRAPHADAKLIRCVRGKAFDVAVDLRPGSPTFGHWHACELDAEQPQAVYIPEGFAHGFQALADGTQLLYLHSAAHVPGQEGGVRHDDPRLGIRWPLPVVDLSPRDRQLPTIAALENGA